MWELDIVKSLLAGGSKDGQEAFNSVEPPHGSIENSCYNNYYCMGSNWWQICPICWRFLLKV